VKKSLLALLVLCCTAVSAFAQTTITLPIGANAVADLGNGPIEARVVSGNASIFTSQGSGTGSTSGSSTALTLTATPATPPLVGGLVSGAGITSGTTVTAYNGTTGITLSVAMTVPASTPVAWGAVCPSTPPSNVIRAFVSANYYIMYTQARVCAISPGGPVNTLLIEPVFFENSAGGTAGIIVANVTPTTGFSSGQGIGSNGSNVIPLTLQTWPFPYRTAVSATDSITTADYFVCPLNTSTVATENLPSSPALNLTFVIKDCNGVAGSNAITITPASGTIDGLTSLVLNAGYSSAVISYMGSQWGIVSLYTGTYVGPGDVVASARAWWGLRAYSAATRGHAAINVCNVSDVACADLITDPSTGKLVITTVGGSNCASVTCTVKKIYDQTAAGNCTGSCDLIQATIADRPVFIVSCVNGLPCVRSSGAAGVVLQSAGNMSQAMPFTSGVVADTTTPNYTGGMLELGLGSGAATLMNGLGGNLQDAYNTINIKAVSATDNHFHNIQMVWATSANLNIDGTSNTAAWTSQAASGVISLFETDVGGGVPNLAGNIVEAGWWSGAFSTTQLTNMSENQNGYWGPY